MEVVADQNVNLTKTTKVVKDQTTIMGAVKVVVGLPN